MSKLLRVLIVEDSEDDALLLVRKLESAGYTLTYERVDTPEAMAAALDQQTWDVVISDYVLPCFRAPDALKMVAERGLDLPFIIVSGAIGEDIAVAAMKAGAHDYVMKGNLARLLPAIERELREAKERQGRRRAEKALGESETRYRNLFNTASDAIFVRDLEGNIVEVNQAASALTGYTVAELAEMNIADLLTRKSFEIVMERQRMQMVDEITSQPYELELIKKDGSRAVIESLARVITDDGQPVAVQAMVRDVTQQKRWRENMLFYISEITRAQEEERKRIARELHDETAQELATLLLDIDAVSKTRDYLSEEMKQLLERLRGRTDSILDGVRRFSYELRPGMLDDLGLIPALETLVEELNREGSINARIEVLGSEQRLSSETELVLFRIVQEALRNIRRHSQATKAVVRVDFAGSEVMISVADNGSGFELPEILGDFAAGGKLGLLGMYERARLLGGSFLVESQMGHGTKVTVTVAM